QRRHRPLQRVGRQQPDAISGLDTVVGQPPRQAPGPVVQLPVAELVLGDDDRCLVAFGLGPPLQGGSDCRGHLPPRFPAIWSDARWALGDPNRGGLPAAPWAPPTRGETRGPGTGLAEPPGIWRPASATSPMPCTKPSAMFPPAVLMGSRPRSTVRFSAVSTS